MRRRLVSHLAVAFLLWVAITINGSLAQTNFTVINTNGPATNRVNLVILAEGYLASQFAQFRTDATNVASQLLTNQPFAEYAPYFNVYAIAVASVQAGSDHPANGQSVNTYFNSSYDPFGDYYISIPAGATGQGKVDALLATYIPQADLVIMLVNDSTTPGGSDGGGKTALVSRAAAFGSLRAILPHETGHVLANLGDEYSSPNPGYPDTEEPNTTTNITSIKWAAWIEPTTPTPTPPTSENLEKVGLFEGAHYHTTGWYRPKINCLMRSFGVGFCEVCTEALILSIYSNARPIDTRTPTNAVVTLTNSAPALFQLQALVPATHNLRFEWKLNGTNLPGATNATLTLSPASLPSGLQTLTARAYDPTAAVRNDPTNLLSQTVSWQLNVNVPQLRLINASNIANRITFTVTGTAPQGVIIQGSTNFLTWSSLATGSLSGGQWRFTNQQNSGLPRQFFRASTPP